MSSSQSTQEQREAEAAAFVARVKRLMMICVGGTFAALAIVLVVIGYRVSGTGNDGASSSGPDMVAMLPKGARVISASVADGRLAVTVEIGGAIEVRLFDAKTLKPAGRLSFATSP